MDVEVLKIAQQIFKLIGRLSQCLKQPNESYVGLLQMNNWGNLENNVQV